MKNVNLSDDKAFNYEKHVWGTTVNRNGYDFPRLKFDYLVQSISSSHKNVLEIGCGAGKFLFSLAELFPEKEYTGVDISSAAIEKARKINRSNKINFIEGNAENLHFNENAFDVIIILDVLEHLNDPQKLIDDCYGFLKPRGLMHVFIPCEAHSVYWLGEKVFGFHTKERTVGHIQRFTRRTAENLFNRSFIITKRKYSFHLLGSSMDYLLFSALLNKKFSSIFWGGNMYYNDIKAKSIKAKILNSLLATGSFIAYTESVLLQNTHLGATGIHLTLQKKAN